MNVMRWVVGLLLVASLATDNAAALVVSTPPTEYYSPVFLTAFQYSRSTQVVETGQVTSDSLDFFELYNETNLPVSLTGWSIAVSDASGDICTLPLEGWILPESYVAAASRTFGLVDGTGNMKTYEACSQQARTITKLELRSPARVEEQLAFALPGAYVRKGLTKTYRSGTFSKDFSTMTSAGRTTIYTGVWYEPSYETSLRIMELMPRARQCAPNETAPDCADFIKIYNPSPADLDLEGLRLRVGYQGQSPTSSNTFPLVGILAAGHYGIINQKTDGSPLSIANDGGYVWLEDTYGIARYDNTIVSYPSAESDTKIGWGWAFDTASSSWMWTSTVTPYDQPSSFTLPVEVEPAEEPEEELTPCASNQYRNPATNRCKLLTTTSSSLQACAANQYRNPATNRCKTAVTAASALVPCAANQARNPLTNRCKLVTPTISSPKPCIANQERNPETNRCRKVVSNVAADFPVEAIRPTAEAVTGWWAFGGVGVLAAGYAAWEWRREMRDAVVRFVNFVASGR